MAIKQLTVFVPNQKGSLVSITDILAKNNINLRDLSKLVYLINLFGPP